MKQPASTVDGTIPTGGIVAYSGMNLPEGFLKCDGSALSRSTYKKLFGALGTTFGSGDGSTTFNIPDLRGRSIIGEGQGSGLTDRDLGDTIGAESHIHQIHDYTTDSTYTTAYSYNSSGSSFINTKGGSLVGTSFRGAGSSEDASDWADGGNKTFLYDEYTNKPTDASFQPSLTTQYIIKYN